MDFFQFIGWQIYGAEDVQDKLYVHGLLAVLIILIFFHITMLISFAHLIDKLDPHRQYILNLPNSKLRHRNPKLLEPLPQLHNLNYHLLRELALDNLGEGPMQFVDSVAFLAF